MQDDRPAAARDAVAQLRELERTQVLQLLCANRPEAVLAAVGELRRHQAVLDQLLSSGPQGDQG